jgi:hypothetical protein
LKMQNQPGVQGKYRTGTQSMGENSFLLLLNIAPGFGRLRWKEDPLWVFIQYIHQLVY